MTPEEREKAVRKAMPGLVHECQDYKGAPCTLCSYVDLIGELIEAQVRRDAEILKGLSEESNEKALRHRGEMAMQDYAACDALEEGYEAILAQLERGGKSG